MLKVGDHVTRPANGYLNVPEFSGVIKRFWRFDANRMMAQVCTGEEGVEDCMLTDVSGLYPTPCEPGANMALSDNPGFTHGTSDE